MLSSWQPHQRGPVRSLPRLGWWPGTQPPATGTALHQGRQPGVCKRCWVQGFCHR